MIANKGKVVRFFTDTGKYMGWCKFSSDKIAMFVSWRRSGNYLKIGDKVYGKESLHK